MSIGRTAQQLHNGYGRKASHYRIDRKDIHAHHQSRILRGESLGNLNGHVVVKAGVLVVNLVVLPLFQSGLLQPLEEAFPAVVHGTGTTEPVQ